MYLKPLPMLTIDIIWRFWNHVDRKSPDECWLWQKTRDFHSVNHTKFDIPSITINKESYSVVRIAYKLFYGVDPSELLVCHTYDNAFCVNPDHLWLGTQSENKIDCVLKGRHYTHNNRKLWESEIDEILELIAQGELTLTAIALKYNVSISTISRYKLGCFKRIDDGTKENPNR